MPTKRKTPQSKRTPGKKRLAAAKVKKAVRVKKPVRAKKTIRAQTAIAPAAPPRAAVGEAAPRRAPPVTMHGILHPGAPVGDPGFRDAPEGWTPAHARAVAAELGVALGEDHWEVIRVLQGCYKDEAAPRLRLLRDALDARFSAKGGIKYLYEILRGGPIVQGCALAGLKPPASATDVSYGSVA